MRTFGLCCLLAGMLQAADLPKVSRNIAARPNFTAERQFFGLLALGPEASNLVWFVIDGNDLFVDSNGNGKLTDDGERIGARRSSADAGSGNAKVTMTFPGADVAPRVMEIAVAPAERE